MIKCLNKLAIIKKIQNRRKFINNQISNRELSHSRDLTNNFYDIY